jgi:hypothetical protein
VRTYQGKHVPLLFNIQLRFSLKLLKIWNSLPLLHALNYVHGHLCNEKLCNI